MVNVSDPGAVSRLAILKFNLSSAKAILILVPTNGGGGGGGGGEGFAEDDLDFDCSCVYHDFSPFFA